MAMLLEAQTLKMESRVLLIDASSNEVDHIAESAGLVAWQKPQEHHAGKQRFVTCEALVEKCWYVSRRTLAFCENHCVCPFCQNMLPCLTSLSKGKCSLCCQVSGNFSGCLVGGPMCCISAAASLYSGRGQTRRPVRPLSLKQRMLGESSQSDCNVSSPMWKTASVGFSPKDGQSV